MEQFKKIWEIQHNWQLLFPFLGVLGLVYSSFKMAMLIFPETHLVFSIVLSIILFLVMRSVFLFLFKKLEDKWVVTYRWEMIRIFIVFAITGSSSVFVGRPIILFLGITKENLNPFAYWALYLIIGLIFYQILLLSFGWLFGQFLFFWDFEKKMLRRMGFKRFFD